MIYLKFCIFVFFIFCLNGAAYAYGTNYTSLRQAFADMEYTVAEAVGGTARIVLVIAGFGLIGFALLAFSGKLNWKWLAALVIGVASISAIGYIMRVMKNSTDSY